MVNSRVWTQESAQAWRDARDERRKAKGFNPYSIMTPSQKAEALLAEKEGLVESESSALFSKAWDLGKHPIETYLAPFSGNLLLPKNYHATSGIQTLNVRKGDDINFMVYNYYNESVDAKTYPGDNYVSRDGLIPRRHEYMGPSPHVACYRLTIGTIEIEWYEPYIKDTWIGTKKWNVEVEFDETVEGWFVIVRNDY